MVKIGNGKVYIDTKELDDNIMLTNRYIELIPLDKLNQNKNYLKIISINFDIKKNKNNLDIKNQLYVKLNEYLVKFINENSNKNLEEKCKDSQCEICYDEIKKGELINICSFNKIKHLFHKNCFDMNLKYSYQNMDVNTKNYQCPYCKKYSININTIYKSI